jgi:hypothetical protein
MRRANRSRYLNDISAAFRISLDKSFCVNESRFYYAAISNVNHSLRPIGSGWNWSRMVKLVLGIRKEYQRLILNEYPACIWALSNLGPSWELVTECSQYDSETVIQHDRIKVRFFYYAQMSHWSWVSFRDTQDDIYHSAVLNILRYLVVIDATRDLGQITMSSIMYTLNTPFPALRQSFISLLAIGRAGDCPAFPSIERLRLSIPSGWMLVRYRLGTIWDWYTVATSLRSSHPVVTRDRFGWSVLSSIMPVHGQPILCRDEVLPIWSMFRESWDCNVNLHSKKHAKPQLNYRCR